MINGAQASDTGVTLTTQQTASLVAHLTNMPAYLDYLGNQQATQTLPLVS
jgi:hypothetical protein